MMKYLIWAGTAALVLTSVFLIVLTGHISGTATTTNTVSFSGEGKITAKPDVAMVSLSIVTDSPNSKTAQDENSRKSKALTDFIKSQGVDEKDIRTTGYNIYPQYNYPPYSKPQITGYQVNQTIELKIRDLEKISTILDGVVTAGANQVNQLSFAIDNPEKLKAEARKKAIEDAEKKAEELENQLDINLGRIINFAESSGGYPVPVYYDAKMEGRGMGGGGGPSVPTGENEIVVNVSLTYQIK